MTAGLSCEVGKLLSEESIPFDSEITHHGGINGWDIPRTERHYAKCVFFAVRTKEGEFVLVVDEDTDLVIALFCIEAEKEEKTCGITEIFESVIAARDGVFEGKCFRVELVIRDTHPPDEVNDVGYVFLVGFRGKDDRGAPIQQQQQ